MQISLIAAMTPERIIGSNGKMPWHLPADLRWFKENTLNKTVIMGRNTWDSIGKALPHRQNIVISRQTNLVLPDAIVVASLEQALAQVSTQPEVMIIGGGQIYNQSLSVATRLYITLIHAEMVGDTYFPYYNPRQWSVSFSHHCAPLNPTTYPCTFSILECNA